MLTNPHDFFIFQLCTFYCYPVWIQLVKYNSYRHVLTFRLHKICFILVTSDNISHIATSVNKLLILSHNCTRHTRILELELFNEFTLKSDMTLMNLNLIYAISIKNALLITVSLNKKLGIVFHEVRP